MSRWAFETPCVEESLTFDSGSQVQESGGLLVAGTDKFSSAIIVPRVPNRIRLEDLHIVPSIELYEHSMDSVVRLVDTLGLWSKSQAPGRLTVRDASEKCIARTA